jgi:hypothetical protein
MTSLYQALQGAKTEEDVKDLYVKALGLKSYPLARSLFDATWKGVWIAFGAEQSTLDQYTQGQYNAKPHRTLKAMSKEKTSRSLERVLPLLNQVVDGPYDYLSDYSHAGLLQIGRWMGEDEVSPKHTDEEMEEILRLSDKLAAASGMCLYEICNTAREDVFARLDQVIGLCELPHMPCTTATALLSCRMTSWISI